MKKTIKTAASNHQNNQKLHKALKVGTALSLSMISFVGAMTFAASSANAIDNLTTPTNGQVVGGSATITRPGAGVVNIDQHTDRAVINWDSFNIGRDALAEFFQPGSKSIAVNRVLAKSSDPTQILGRLKANGQVMVLDRNGVFFGKDARIDVGGIVASTGDIDTGDFMKGGSTITLKDVGSTGKIVNEGTITVSEGGLAAFVAPTVVNNGLIAAKLGKIALAGGSTQATVDLYGDGLVEFAIDEQGRKAIVENAGVLDAESGTIALTTGAAKTVVDSVINMSGVARVGSVSQQGGKIVLNAKGGKVNVAGDIDASGTKGGKVDIRAQDIYLTGDITADGGEGNVVLWGDNSTLMTGSISALGDNAFVETSGALLGVHGQVTLSEGSEWLLDPTDLVIRDNNPDANPVLSGGIYSPDDSAGDSVYYVGTSFINTALNAGNNITLQTHANGSNEGDITVQGNISKTSGSNATLTLNAHDDITVNGSINSTNNRLNVLLNADFDNSGGDSNVTVNGSVQTNGGYFTANAANHVTVGASGLIGTTGGTVTLNAKSGNVASNTGGVINAGEGNMRLNASNTVNVTNLSGDKLFVDANNAIISGNVQRVGDVSTTGFLGNFTLTNVGDVAIDGLVNSGRNTRITSTAGKVTVNGTIKSTASDVYLKGNSIDLASGAIATDILDLRSDTTLSQNADGHINITELQGSAAGAASLTGTGNKLNIAGFMNTNGGFALNDSAGGLTINTIAATGPVSVSVVGNTTVTGTVDAAGGDVALAQTGRLTAGAGSIKTSGTGKISLEQNTGGTIQGALNAISNTGTGINTLTVGNGTYVENLTVRGNTTLLSKNGRGLTTIQGVSGVNALGAITLIPGANNITIGDTGKGFTVVGIDNGAAGIKNAAIYVQGNHSNVTIRGNDVVANGDLGLVTEFNAVIDGLVIDNNIFSGKTFVGPTVGLGGQFSTPNAPRSLVYINGDNVSDVEFTNNQVTGTAGGMAADGTTARGNVLVNIDANGAVITGNDFAGTTTGSGMALRARGTSTLVSGNTFDATGLTHGAGYLYLSSSALSGLPLGSPSSMADVLAANSVSGGNYVTASAYLNGNGFVGTTINSVIAAAAAGADINASAGTYNESVLLNKQVNLKGANAGINGTDARGAETIIQPNSPGILITADGATVDGVMVNGGDHGIQIDGASDVSVLNSIVTAAGQDGIYADGADNITIKGNYVHNVAGAGITAVNADGAVIGGAGTGEFNTVNAVALNGIGVGESDGVTVEGNKVSDTGRVGIYFGTVTNSDIKGNEVSASHLAGYGAISTDWGSGNSISGNVIDGTDALGIHVQLGNGAVTISDNIIDNTADAGIVVKNNVTATVSGNQIGTKAGSLVNNNGVQVIGGTVNASGNTIANTLYSAIALTDVAGATITGNTIYNTGYGLYAEGSSTGINATGNSITGIVNKSVWNNGTGSVFNASGNWWGSTDAATILGLTQGDVDITPFLMSGTDTDTGTQGFQGDKSNVTVTALGSQSGTTGRVQEGVDTVDAGGTVNVGAGNFAGSVAIDKALTLKGANAGVNPNNAVRGAETIITGDDWYVLSLEGNDITVDGLTVIGDNDAAVDDYGIVAYNADNASIRNNIVKDASYGIFNWGSGTPTFSTIENNNISNVAGHAIHVRDNAYADVLNNVISGAAVGIGMENFGRANPEGRAAMVSGNTVSASRIGIRSNLSYGTATGFEVSGNTITAENTAETRRWTGIDVISMADGVNTLFKNNTIDGAAVNATRDTYGYELTNLTGDDVVIDGGTVRNTDVGVWATDGSAYNGPVNGLLVKNVAFRNMTDAAIYVEDVEGNAGVNATGTTITLGSGNTFNNVPYHVILSGDSATVNLEGGATGVNKTLVKAAGTGRFAGYTTNNASITKGINATATGGTVTVEAGTFAESVLMGKALTLKGAGAGLTIIDPVAAGQDGLRIDGNMAGGTATINGFTFKGGHAGVFVTQGTVLDTLNILNSNFEGNSRYGVGIGELASSPVAVSNVLIRNADFLNNGSPGTSSGDGDIQAAGFNGNITLKNVSIENDSPLGLSDYGIQIRGTDALAASGNIAFDNVTVKGKYRAALVGLNGFSALNLTMNDVTLGGATTLGTASSGWGAFYVSNAGSNALNLGNTRFGAINGLYILNDSANAMDATAVRFEGKTGATANLAQNLAIEDKVSHALDVAGKGLVTWNAGNIYVTQGSGSIQRGVDNAVTGGKVWVGAGTFNENVNVNKSVTIDGAGAGSVLQGAGTGSGFNVTADNVTLKDIIAKGFLYGINVTSLINDLTLNNVAATDNAVAGFKVAADSGIDGLTISGSSFDNNAYGFYAEQDATGSTAIENVTVSGTSFSNNTAEGIYTEKLSDATFNNVTVSGNATSGININLKRGDYANITFNRLTATGNGGATVSVKARNDGAYAANPASLTGLTIKNSTIDTANSAIEIGNNVDGASVTNNTQIKGGQGITVYGGAKNVTITGNAITSTGDYGVSVKEGAQQVTIGGVQANKANTISGGDTGVIINDADQVTVQKNTITGVDNGIEVSGGSVGAQLIGNSITGSSTTGVNINGASGTVVNGGSITHFDTGIKVTDSDNVVISNGLVITDVTDGISADNSEGLEVQKVSLTGRGTATGTGIKLANGSTGATIGGAVADKVTVTSFSNGIVADASGGITIRNNDINTLGNDGIRLTANGVGATIADNDITDVNGDGIYVSGATTGLVITGNELTDIGDASGDNGIEIYGSTGAAIGGFLPGERNVIDTVAGDGIYFNGADLASIINNEVIDATGAAIAMIDTTTGLAMLNAITGSGIAGIYASGGSDLTAVLNGIATTSGDGIYAENLTGTNLLGGNIILDADGNGIKANGVAGLTIGGNLIDNSGNLTKGISGITVSGGSTGALVSGNTVSGNGTTGIVIASSNGVEVNGGSVTGFDTGVSVAQSENARIRGGLSVTDVATGIKGVDAKGIVIRNVDLTGRGATGTGIDLATSNGARVGGPNPGQLVTVSTFSDGIAVSGSNNVIIEKADLDTLSDDGIVVTGGRNVDIIGNDIDNAGDTAINVDGVTQGLVIKGNILDTGGVTGINVNASKGAIIGGALAGEANTIANKTGAGINVTSSANADIIANDVDSVGTGIVVTGGRNVDIIGNDVDNATGTAIFADSVTEGLVIKGNVLDTGGADGINVTSSDGAVIGGVAAGEANTVSGKTGTGIAVSASDNVDIINNDVTDAGTGITVTGGKSADIVLNYLNNILTAIGIDVTNNDGVLVDDNDVYTTATHGIRVRGSGNDAATGRDVTVTANVVDGAGRDGIVFNNVTDGMIYDNDVNGAIRHGVRVANGTGNTVDFNYITNSGSNGIEASASENLTVTDNEVYQNAAGNHGINIANGTGTTEIAGNLVDTALVNGINVSATSGLNVNLNNVSGTVGNGIVVTGSTGAVIDTNTVTNTVGSAIMATTSNGVQVIGSIIDTAFASGIVVTDSNSAVVSNNDVKNTSVDGIRLENGVSANVEGNTVDVAGADGIALDNVKGVVLVDDNTVTDASGNGISVDGAVRATLSNNEVSDAVLAGIRVAASDDTVITGNTLVRNTTGIRLDDVTDTRIQGNTVSNSLSTGIEIDGTSDGTSILANAISGSSQFGLRTTGRDVESVLLRSNTFTNNRIGAQFQSGLVDLTSRTDYNSFTGGVTALRLAPAGLASELALVGDTLGWTRFAGQTGYFVQLANAAYYAGGTSFQINGIDAYYNGFSPALSQFGRGILTVSQLQSIEGKMYDLDDVTGLGQVYVGYVPGLSNEDAFPNGLGTFGGANGGFSVTIAGLPGAGGPNPGTINPGNLNDIDPAAGGDETAEALNELNPAAGEETGCWNDMGTATQQNATVTYTFSATLEEAMKDDTGCQQ